uniref:Uncharacterized protein n=1 Tax=viral metagenome TaxID=1070528 RepID=A0A6C0FDU6_9ZZZZ|tara:strand:- start:3087 stop:3581 length:495 start_codon:yes stop_codon:yes gene_type:complete
MLTWREIVLHALSKGFPPEVVIIILSFLKRESISHLCSESRDYHVRRMPRVERLFYADYGSTVITDDYYLNIKVTDDSEEEANVYSQALDELTDKWYTINPKGKEYKYFDIWRWSRFEFPYMNFIPSFNRGRIFLRFLKGYEWYDLNSEDNIVDKLTDYKQLFV